jgi:phage terminase small subunit
MTDDRTAGKRRETLNNALAQRPDPRPFAPGVRETPWRDLQGLTWQEDLFVTRLDAGADIGEAYIAAGYKSASIVKARAAGRSLLKKPYVKAELERRVEVKGRARVEAAKMAIEHSGITLARVASELGRVAFSNMMDYMRIDPATGDPALDWASLTREQAAALTEVTVDDYVDGRGENARDVRKVKFKLGDKRAALMDIAKLFGWIVEKRENKIVDEFDTMTEEQLDAWLDERAEQRVRMKQRTHDLKSRMSGRGRGGIGGSAPDRSRMN